MVLGIRSDPVLLERTNPRPAGDVLVHLTRDCGVALHRQIEASIRDAIRAGRLPRGTSLPPTRGLADELGVSRGVVVEAYQQLIAEGYLTSRAGGYTRVAIGPELPAGAPSPVPAAGATIDFCPCRADGSQFPRAAWLRSLRRVLTEVSDEEFGYVSGRGAPALHEALAAIPQSRARHVCQVRPHRDLQRLRPGNRAAHPDARDVRREAARARRPVGRRRRAPARTRGRPGGRRGSGRRRRRPRRRARPHGGRRPGPHALPPVAHRSGALGRAPRRRAALGARAASARHRGRLRRRVPLRPGSHRSHAGSRPGPRRLRRDREQDARARTATGLARRARSSRRRHRRRQEARRSRLARPRSAGLRRLRGPRGVRSPPAPDASPLPAPPRRAARGAAEHAPELEPAGIAAGLHLVAYLPDGVDETAVVEAAARRGVAVYGLAPYRIACEGRPGLIFGYATLGERALAEGIEILGEALSELSAP